MKILAAILLAITFLSAAAFAQYPPPPAPELKKLDYFVGTWTMDGDVKPGPMGPGGKSGGSAKYEWMDGNYFLVSHTTFSGVMGEGTETAYMGYDSKKKVYTYDSFSSAGMHNIATATVSGDNWTWLFDMDMGNMQMKGRFSTVAVSPASYTYKFEMSPDGANWNTVLEGKAAKK